jgi:oligo-1,6-glucosidase
MKLVMDLVVNHTSDEHPWFVESRSSQKSPKRDWYIWRDARDGAAPNDWRSFFSGSAWEWEESTDQYYLHLFDRTQPDLNWENPQVRKAVQDIMVWWLDRGVDGFRTDVINFISKAEGFIDGPHVHDYLAEVTRKVFGDRRGEFITVGEMPGVTPEQARLYTDPARGELNMVFQFEHMSVDQNPTNKFDYLSLDLRVLKRALHRWQAALAETGWNSLYWNNHDQPRVVSRFGDDDPGLLGCLGESARHRSARHARNPVRLSRRGTRNDELPVPNLAGPYGYRGRQLLHERPSKRW